MSSWLSAPVLSSSVITHACYGSFRAPQAAEVVLDCVNHLQLVAVSDDTLQTICKQPVYCIIQDLKSLTNQKDGRSQARSTACCDSQVDGATSLLTVYVDVYRMLLITSFCCQIRAVCLFCDTAQT